MIEQTVDSFDDRLLGQIQIDECSPASVFDPLEQWLIMPLKLIVDRPVLPQQIREISLRRKEYLLIQMNS